jgi:hypothetical protein
MAKKVGSLRWPTFFIALIFFIARFGPPMKKGLQA